jgi:predicted ATPase
MTNDGLRARLLCQAPCDCTHDGAAPKLVVVTGGPGAGKTALLETVRRQLCRHVAVLPEAATILFGGGFPRSSEPPAREAAQRAIFAVQRQLERLAIDLHLARVILCDRGTIDGAAYWQGDPDGLWRDVGTTLDDELARYAAVLHLRVPAPSRYDVTNRLRIESAVEAARIDDRILEVWGDHPRRFVIPDAADFVEKVARAAEVIRNELPACCRRSAEKAA